MGFVNTSIFKSKYKSIFVRFLKWLLFIIGITAITGFVVDYFLFNMFDFTRPSGPYHSYKYAFVFTTFITVFNLTTKKWLDRHYVLNNRLSLILHVSVQTLSAVAGFLTAMFVGGLLFSTPTSHSIWNDEVQQKALVIVILVSFLAALIINSFWYGYEFFNRLISIERAYSESRMAALRAQVNPHFLFNSLNSIVSLIRIEPDKAEEVTHDLADLFRYSLKSSKRPFVEIEKEFESIETYLSIEKARFGDRINTSFYLPDDLRQTKIPGFVLQPLVENAIKHGASNVEGELEIGVTARNVANSLSLTVTDNGPGFNSLNLDYILSQGSGLSNVYDRIKTTYGNAAHFIIHPNGVELQLPLSYSLDSDLRNPFKHNNVISTNY